MRILITGSTGKLGGHILQNIEKSNNISIYTLSRKNIDYANHFKTDITQLDHLTNLLKSIDPTHIIHLAAISNPEFAEKNRDISWITNVGSTEIIANYAQKNGSTLVFASSDFVFSGTLGRCYIESDIPNPTTFYGHTKLEAEKIILNAGGTVARLSMLYGYPVDSNITTTFTQLLQKIQCGEPLPVLVDEWRTPIRYEDASKAILNILEMQIGGIFHIGGPEVMTIENMMQKCVSYTDRPVTFERLYRSNFSLLLRPKYVGLDSSKIKSIFPNWKPSHFYEKDELLAMLNK